jgi:hypothetical protein
VGWRRDEKGSNDPCSAELAKKKNPNYFFFQQVHATHRPTDHAMSILLETKNAHSQGGENIFRACCAVPKQTEIRNLNSDSTLAQTREQVRRIRLPDPAITRADLRGLDLMPSLRMEGRRSTVIDGGRLCNAATRYSCVVLCVPVRSRQKYSSAPAHMPIPGL